MARLRTSPRTTLETHGRTIASIRANQLTHSSIVRLRRPGEWVVRPQVAPPNAVKSTDLDAYVQALVLVAVHRTPQLVRSLLHGERSAWQSCRDRARASSGR